MTSEAELRKNPNAWRDASGRWHVIPGDRQWTCQHGTVKRGYATPTANCADCRASDCVWRENEKVEG